MRTTEIKFHSALNLCFCGSGVADEGLVQKRKWYSHVAHNKTYAGLGAVAAWLLWRRSVRVGKISAHFEAAHRSLVLAIDTQRAERRQRD